MLQVCPAQLDLKATKELLVPLVPLECPDMESQVQMDRRERGELQVAQVLQVQRVILVILDTLVLQVQLALLVLLDHRVREVHQVSPVL